MKDEHDKAQRSDAAMRSRINALLGISIGLVSVVLAVASLVAYHRGARDLGASGLMAITAIACGVLAISFRILAIANRVQGDEGPKVVVTPRTTPTKSN